MSWQLETTSQATLVNAESRAGGAVLNISFQVEEISAAVAIKKSFRFGVRADPAIPKTSFSQWRIH